MAVKKIKYFKEFLSESGIYLGADKHHLPQPYIIQQLNQEDKNIQDEILEKYGSWKNENRYVGSDETFTYSFDFSAPEIHRNPPLRVKKKYKEIVEISKSGNINKLNELSDLEEFLIKNDFKILKD